MPLMKKLFLIAVIFLPLLSLAQKQQEEKYYRPFKLNFMVFGCSGPLLNTIQHGYVFAFEPKYVISNRWEAGGRFELAYIGPYKEIRYVKSIVVMADYFLNTNQMRPFFGMGLGSFTTSPVPNGTALQWYTLSGINWRVGLEYWHLRASVEANILSKDTGDLDYLSFKFGGHVSFGKKKSR